MNRTHLPPLPPLPLPGGELPLGDAGNRKRPLDELLPEPPVGLVPGGLPVEEPFLPAGADPMLSEIQPPLVPG